MLNNRRTLVVALGALGLVSLNSAVAHELGKANASYVGDMSGHLVTDGYGDCVKTGSWSKDADLVDCGAAPPKVVAPEPAPQVVAVAPAPVTLMAVSLSAGALFDLNKDTLKDAGKAELDELATRIQGMKEVRSLKIVGHTDSTGTDAYNQQLSERRAAAVKTYLQNHGISSSMMTTLGMGESQPTASNATREGRAQNRRVEISVQGMTTSQ
jgi:OOP family OmpA-OmpF porin